MPIWLAIVLAVAAVLTNAIQALTLFIVKDLRDRVVRLENPYFKTLRSK